MTEVQKRVPIKQAVERVEESTGLKFEDDGKPDAELRFLHNVAVRAAQIKQAQSPDAQEARRRAEATQEQGQEAQYIDGGGKILNPRVVTGNRMGRDAFYIEAQYQGWIN